MRKLVSLLRTLVIRTQGTPLRPIWAALHHVFTDLLARYLLFRIPHASVYLTGVFGGVGEPVYGISDIDLIIVLPPDESGHARSRVMQRWSRAERILPLASGLVDLFVYDEHDLKRALSAPPPTFSLNVPWLDDPGAGADFSGPSTLRDEKGLHDRPGLYEPTFDWCLLWGPDRRPPRKAYDDQQRRIVAWLELQFWWRYVFPLCVDPSSAWASYLCLKLVAEPARILLWLLTGERLTSRREVLERGLRSLPREEAAFRRALELNRKLSSSPAAPVDEFLPTVIRLSSMIVERLSAELANTARTGVHLSWGGEEELVVEPRARDRRSTIADTAGPRLRPLVDWRALVVPQLPDETFFLLEEDPNDRIVLSRVAREFRAGPYPTLRTEALLILPAAHERAQPGAFERRGVQWARVKFRGIQCPLTDPVSFALAAGKDRAGFPEVAGWSAWDVARRAVAEHRAWLSLRPGERPPLKGWLQPQPDPAVPTTESLGRLFTAARAALLEESLTHGSPRLALTVAAVAEALAERGPRVRSVSLAAHSSYLRARDGSPPTQRTVEEFGAIVRKLPTYEKR